MEFNEKLQELRKARSLTQEELAEALYVSRTAISKWESGRGYPSIDSLKEISRFFSVTIDELICSDEMITVAENDKREFVSKYISLICCVMDVLLVMLMFIPAFGNGTDFSGTVSLFGLTGISPWVRIVFIVIISIAILNGICGVIIAHFNKPVWSYGIGSVDTRGYSVYCDKAAVCRYRLFSVPGYKRFFDSQNEMTT